MDILEAIAAAQKDGPIKTVWDAFAAATKDDLPVLLTALQSDSIGFDVRELLAEPVIQLGGVRYLPDLMVALRMNFDDGHDNDGFQASLADLAEREPDAVREALKAMTETAEGEALKDITWLLEYCG